MTAALALAVCVKTLPAQRAIGGPEAWVQAYQKLGGKATLPPGEKHTVAITKIRGQSPLIALSDVAAAKGVRGVKLYGFAVTDDDLATLATWKGLESVTVLDGKEITDKGLKPLATSESLKELVLLETVVTGAGLATLSGHKSLERLEVGNTVTTGAVVTLTLTALPHLESLVLNCEGLEQLALAKTPRLREIYRLPGSLKVADLSGLGWVSELEFQGSSLTKLTIQDAPHLKSVNLVKTKIGELDLRLLRASLPNASVKR